ncbi:MAG TPA: hypothetical protein V6C78_00690 [Crinalium sp.]
MRLANIPIFYLPTFHINRILSRLGMSDRTQAAVVVLKRGIAKLPIFN